MVLKDISYFIRVSINVEIKALLRILEKYPIFLYII